MRTTREDGVNGTPVPVEVEEKRDRCRDACFTWLLGTKQSLDLPVGLIRPDDFDRE